MIKINDIPAISWNLRWLALKRESDSSLWAKQISTQTKNTIKTERAQKLIEGELPSDAEIAVLQDQYGLEKEDLVSGKLFESKKGLFKQNIEFLIVSLPKGENHISGKELGVHPQQLSRWKSGAIKPQPKNLKKLLRLHGFDPDTNLNEVALFLQMEEISSFQKKAWVLKRMESLSPNQVASLFEAFKKLLTPYAKD